MRNKIPKHWQVEKLGEICILDKGKISTSGSLPYLEVKFLRGLKSAIYKEEGVLVNNNQVVILVDGENSGEVFQINQKGYLGSTFRIIDTSRELDLNYCVKFILYNKDKFKNSKVGTAIPHLNKKVFNEVKIPLPPLNEQNLIVKKIESCFEKIDLAISNFKKSKELIGIYKQSVLSHAFNGKLTNSNLNSWQVKKLGEICEILDNKRKPINSSEREMRLNLSMQRFPYFGATGQVGFIDDYIFDFEAILLGEDGAPFLDFFKNKAYIVSGKYWVNNHAHILKAINGISTNYFICYFLNSINYAPYVSGTTRLKLNQESMKNIKIPLPPLSEQNLIVSQIEKRFKAADNALNLIEQNLKKAEILKQSILSKAFNGELIKDKNE